MSNFRLFQFTQKARIAGAIGQTDVERAPGLPYRVVVLLMHREGKDMGVGLEHECRAVAVVDVEIDNRRALDAA